MTCKLLGAMMVIFGCGFSGISMALEQKHQEQLLRQLIRSIGFMICDLSFRSVPLSELCHRAASRARGPVAGLLTGFENHLLEQSGDVMSCMEASLNAFPGIPKRIRELALELGGSLGQFDLEGQRQRLEEVMGECRTELEQLRGNLENRQRSYRTLGFCAGAALAILFV